MNVPIIRDLVRQVPRKSGKQTYFDLRKAGLKMEAAARGASISLRYAEDIETLLQKEMSADRMDYAPSRCGVLGDDAHVAALVSLGGYPSLSERLTRTGHVACLPLIQFGGAA